MLPFIFSWKNIIECYLIFFWLYRYVRRVVAIIQDYVYVLRIEDLKFESNEDPILSSGTRIIITSGVQPTERGEGGHRRNVVVIS